jgi:hypothetical protein
VPVRPAVVTTAPTPNQTGGVAIVDRAPVAAALAEQGTDVVLVLDPDAGYVPSQRRGPGRVAVLIGRLEDPVVRSAAEEMAAELFGRAP